MSNWSKPSPKTRRCRLNCGNGFFIIEDPSLTRSSYRLEYQDSTGKRRWIRMDKNRIRDREVAEKESWRLRQEIANDALPKASSDIITFCEGIPLYLKDKKAELLRCYRAIEQTMENRLEPYFGEMRLKDITLQTVKEYRDMRRKTVGDDAIIRDCVYLKEFFKFMIDLGFMDKNPIAERKKLKLLSSKRDRYMSVEEEQVIWPLLEKYPPMLALADFALHTSMRPGNILSLRWDKILWDRQEAKVPKELHKQKNKDGYYLLDGAMLEMLKRLQELNSQNGCSPLVFTRYVDGKHKEIKPKWIQRIWNEVMKEAGIKNLHFYDLRTTCITRMAALPGTNVFNLKRVSNHSSTASLERYVSQDALKEATLELMEKKNQIWNRNGVDDRSKIDQSPQGRELNN